MPGTQVMHVPYNETIISMIELDGRIILATQKHVYELCKKSDCEELFFNPIDFVEAEE